MNKKIYSFILALILVATISCKDDSLLPLPYNDRITGAYLRIYKQTSNVLDLGGAVGDLSNAALANSAFDVIFEPVDEHDGDDLASVDFFVSHRRGTDLTQEVFVKSLDASIFTAVPAPTYSVYKRGAFRLTAIEALNALRTITADPDGDGSDTNGDGKAGDQCPLCIPFKGLAAFGAAGTFQAGDQVNIRYEMVMKSGQRFSVSNPQSTVNPAFANNATANSTPNITTGQFYSSPFVVIMTVRSQPPGSWVGDYSLTQNAIWSLNHSAALHASSFPSYMNEVLFPNQTVTLTIPSGGLSTEREFTVTYKGTSTTMRINLENGTTWVPLQNSTVDCNAERELYWCMPTTGSFDPTGFTLPAGLPQGVTANRGTYTAAQTGLVAGQTISIGLDDDCDEYGRRNGYCTWTRRVRLVLTKL